MEVKPGYKQTEVGVIPEDWEVEPLGTRGSFKTGPFGSTLHQSDYVDGGVPVINPMHINDGRLTPSATMSVSEEAARRLVDFRMKPGEIVIGRRGDMGRCAVAYEEHAGWICGTGSMLIRLRSDHPDFLQRILSSPIAVKAIEDASVGSTMINLNQATLSQLNIQIPPVDEQRAIATALSDMDALLDGLDRLIAKKRAIKQAALQQLLTGQTRLPGFSGEWEVNRLGDLGATYGGLVGKNKADFGSGSAKYVPFINVMANVQIDCTAFDTVNVDATENQNKVVKGDLLFNGSSETPEEVALCSFMSHEVKDLYLNSFCFGFRIKDISMVDGLFFAYYMRSPIGRDLMKSLAQGSTRYNLSKSALLEAQLVLPGKEEQTAIATILSDMDAEITAIETRRIKTRALKQAMMQELLTGRTRLV